MRNQYTLNGSRGRTVESIVRHRDRGVHGAREKKTWLKVSPRTTPGSKRRTRVAERGFGPNKSRSIRATVEPSRNNNYCCAVVERFDLRRSNHTHLLTFVLTRRFWTARQFRSWERFQAERSPKRLDTAVGGPPDFDVRVRFTHTRCIIYQRVNVKKNLRNVAPWPGMNDCRSSALQLSYSSAWIYRWFFSTLRWKKCVRCLELLFVEEAELH